MVCAGSGAGVCRRRWSVPAAEPPGFPPRAAINVVIGRRNLSSDERAQLSTCSFHGVMSDYLVHRHAVRDRRVPEAYGCLASGLPDNGLIEPHHIAWADRAARASGSIVTVISTADPDQSLGGVPGGAVDIDSNA